MGVLIGGGLVSLDVEPAQAKVLQAPDGCSEISGVEPAAVCNTRCGDGHYPLYVETKDGFSARLVIELETEAGSPADGFAGEPE